MEKAVTHFKKDHDVIDVDGARVLFGDGWALLVRTVDYLQQFDGHEWNFEGDRQEVQRKPLLRASRDRRVAAIDEIPGLIDALHVEGAEILSAVTTAQEIAESLD